jgi:hypothetical protein
LWNIGIHLKEWLNTCGYQGVAAHLAEVYELDGATFAAGQA